MKLLRKISEDTSAYDYGIKDAFGNKAEVWINEALESYTLMGKNPYYKQEQKYLDSIKCKGVHVAKHLEVIDITKMTLEKLEELFPDITYKPQFQVW